MKTKVTSQAGNLLALAEKEYQDKLAELNKTLEKKKGDLLNKVKKDLGDAFGAALEIFNTLPTDERKSVMSEPAYELVLSALGLEVKQEKVKKARKPRKTATTVTDEEIIKFVAIGETTTGSIQKQFGFSPVTVGKRLKDLVAGKKISMRKDGVKKLYKKA